MIRNVTAPIFELIVSLELLEMGLGWLACLLGSWDKRDSNGWLETEPSPPYCIYKYDAAPYTLRLLTVILVFFSSLSPLVVSELIVFLELLKFLSCRT